MKRIIAITVGAAALAASAMVLAQGVTPNVTLSDQQRANQLIAQLQSTNSQLRALNANVAHTQQQLHIIDAEPGGSIVPAPPSSDVAVPPMSSPPPAMIAKLKVPAVPTEDDIRHLELALDRARSERRARGVLDEGTETATSAEAVRAEVVFPYIASSVYEVLAAPDHMTAILLQPGETITTDNGKPKAADTVQWVADTVSTGEGSSKRTIVMVKPVTTGIETNMLIPTNRRVYSVLLRSDSQAYMPLVTFNYPSSDTPSLVPTVATSSQPAPTAQFSLEHMNFGYRLSRSKQVWAPRRVFDDGSKTYLEMSPAMKSWEAPAFFVMEGKTPELVNYRVKGDYYIVDRLFERGQLRIGKQHVDITRENPEG